MIKQILLLSTILLFAQIAYSQNFTKDYFIRSDWFANNHDSSFYKSDTIKLIRYSNIVNDYKGDEDYDEFEMLYLNHGDFIQLEFDRYGKMQLIERVDNSTYIVFDVDWTWKFYNKNSILSIELNGESIMKLMPILENKIQIESRAAYYNEIGHNNKYLSTTELLLIRKK